MTPDDKQIFPSDLHPPENNLIYETMGQLLRLAEATSNPADWLTRIFPLLESGFRVSAMMLEITEGPALRCLPFGQPTLLAVEDSSLWKRVRLRVTHASAPLANLVLIQPTTTELPSRIAHFLSHQLGQMLALEKMQRQIAEAEDRSHLRIRELATLYEIGQAVDQIDTAHLMQMIVERTAHLMDAQACSLMLQDAETKALRVVASHGLPDIALTQEKPIGDGYARQVSDTEQPLVLKGDMRQSRRDEVEPHSEIACSMLVPMKDREGGVLGVLAIRRHQPATDFSPEDLRLFSVFASQAALAITNVRLYSDLESRASELTKLSSLSRSLISTIERDPLLERIADDLCSIVGFSRCCLFIRDGLRSSTFTPRALRGYPEAIGRTPVKQGEGAIGAVARRKAGVLFDAKTPVAEEEERERSYRQLRGLARSLGTNTFIALPLLNGLNECLGVVVADNKGHRGRREPITKEQQRLLATFIDQAAIAIEHAYLYVEAQENSRNILKLRNYTESVLQSSLAGIISTDARGMIARWNRAAETTLEREASRFRDKPLLTLLSELRLTESEEHLLSEAIGRVIETGEPFHQPKFSLHPQGRDSLTLNLMLSRLPDQSGVVLIFEDVTQENRLEAKVKEMHRLADIGQLAARMAHEVRNTLSPIKGAAQLMHSDYEAQDASTEWPDIILSEVETLSRLTSEMLDFARPIPLDVRSISVASWLQGAVQSLTVFLEEHRVNVHWKLADNLPDIHADPVQLGQIVRNLVMNAGQALPVGGDLTISATYDEQRMALSLGFTDNGIGIPEEERERIFRPFVTTRTKGTGLGLPIVQKIVHQHGGDVRVISEVGVGTTFFVALPLHPPYDMARALLEEPPVISRQAVGSLPDN